MITNTISGVGVGLYKGAQKAQTPNSLSPIVLVTNRYWRLTKIMKIVATRSHMLRP